VIARHLPATEPMTVAGAAALLLDLRNRAKRSGMKLHSVPSPPRSPR
jgi:hypothetical protein